MSGLVHWNSFDVTHSEMNYSVRVRIVRSDRRKACRLTGCDRWEECHGRCGIETGSARETAGALDAVINISECILSDHYPFAVNKAIKKIDNNFSVPLFICVDNLPSNNVSYGDRNTPLSVCV